MTNNYRTLTFLSALLIGCATAGGVGLSTKYGKSEVRDRDISRVIPGQVDYWKEVKPILDRRCVECHGCWDAPCQLKLQSIEGLDRGATHGKVYDSARLRSIRPTRLYEDASSTQEWRERGFFPVLNEHDQVLEANREAGVMYRMLELKKANPLPEGERLSNDFDISLNRNDFCAQPGNMGQYERLRPLAGMPYALPGLPDDEFETLTRWLEEGAHRVPRDGLEPFSRSAIARWERFLNRDSVKVQLVARYIYEHLFLAHLHFSKRNPVRWFRLVRSKSPPGQPVDRIATPRPFDDPGVDRVYYRIVEDPETVIAKTHMPYLLDDARMKRWLSIFDQPDYVVEELPGYTPEVASNPLRTFEDIPTRSRYRFMLEEARYTIDNFIKGPVCRGQVALNVIDDHFWVFFLEPGLQIFEKGAQLIQENANLLDMPAGEQSDIFRPVTHWRSYKADQRKFLDLRAEYIGENLTGKHALNMEMIWDGDGMNPNAALTIFRHFDSATVEQGLLGGSPKTAWVIGYSLLERIHYLLVAGYDVYGNLGHQVITRNYMDFLRMEGESTFLYFLPEPARSEVRNYWYRGASMEVLSYLEVPRAEWDVAPGIDYETDDPKSELFALLEKRVSKALNDEFTLGTVRNEKVRKQLTRLTELVGGPVVHLPQVGLLEVRGEHESEYISLVRNNAHSNISSVFRENSNRLPQEDDLSVMNGFIGSYPNAFYVVMESEIEEFVDAIRGLSSEEDYDAMLDRFSERRTSPDFWQHSDNLHRAYREMQPIRWGWLDFSRLEDR